MTTVTSVKVALTAIGLVVWGYGYRVDDPTIRWVGIACLVAALLLRFVARRQPPAS